MIVVDVLVLVVDMFCCGGWGVSCLEGGRFCCGRGRERRMCWLWSDWVFVDVGIVG